MLKRTFDIIFSIFALVLLIPIMLLIILLVFFSLGKPILFKQDRPGKDGKIFKIYKFRTLKNLKDSSGNILEDQLNQTRIGNFLRKSSLDEIPELFNVLIGEMSLVGPRPLMIDYLSRYNSFQARRHEVLPGITGWAQVNGRNKIKWEEKFNLDVWYIDNQSLFLDIKIILLTIKNVLMMKNVNQTETVTMEPFLGNSKKN